MHFLEMFSIAERGMELLNPTSPEKIVAAGEALGLAPETRLIEFGCGYGEVLAIWAERFGIRGDGVELRTDAVERARSKLAERGLADRLTIHESDGAAFAFEEHAYDVAACIGASFIWGGFTATLDALKRAMRPGGRIAVGEPYWLHTEVPAPYLHSMAGFLTEKEILEASRAAGLTVAGVVRASHDDWDRYVSGNLRGLLAWLRENPDHPERADVLGFLTRWQDDYLPYEREHVGWAIYVLEELPTA